jgi:thiosulfate reductase cytochrome b subunit
MTAATKRSILRWIHLVATIPVVGFIYSKPSEVEQYINGPRYIFVPLLILTGYWMYAGMVFAILGVGVWLGGFQVGGFGAALLGQIVLLIGWKIWSLVCGRRAK